MLKISIILIVFLLGSPAGFAQAPAMVEGWPYLGRKSADRINFSIPQFSMADRRDISSIFFNAQDGQLHRFHFDASFYPGWPAPNDSVEFLISPILADLDHDGRSEMLTIGYNYSDSGHYQYSLLLAVDDDGSLMPGFPIVLGAPYLLNAADLDNDGEYEIVTDAWQDRLILCLDRFGQPKPGWPISMPDDYWWQHYSFSAAIGDIDNDGYNEIIADGLTHIYAFRHDGSQASGFPIAIWDATLHYSPNFMNSTLGDIDNDGSLEIFISGDDWTPDFLNPQNSFVAIYENTGELKTGWPLIYHDVFISGAVTPCDIDHDGSLEIGYQAGSDLQFVDASGQILPGWPVTPRNNEGWVRASFSDLITVDIDGDAFPEVFTDFNQLYPDSIVNDSITFYGYSHLFGLDHQGRDLPGFPIVVNGWYPFHPPAFAFDISTHRVYMGLLTDAWVYPLNVNDTAYLELYLFPDSTGPTTEWPMLSHDNLHTRNYNFVDRVTSVVDQPPPLPHSPTLAQNYPNPFNNATVIEFTLPQEEKITLALYDVLGRKVVELYNGRYPAGSYKHNLQINVPSGLYFYTLQTERTRINRKMVVLK